MKVKSDKYKEKAEKPSFVAPPQPNPIFSFQHIDTDDFCIKKCNLRQFKSISDKLRILSSLSWKDIDKDDRKANGYEHLDQNKLFKNNIPFAEKEEKIMIFRFSDGRIAGVRREAKFYILLIESTLGNLYDHGS